MMCIQLLLHFGESCWKQKQISCEKQKNVSSSFLLLHFGESWWKQKNVSSGKQKNVSFPSLLLHVGESLENRKNFPLENRKMFPFHPFCCILVSPIENRKMFFCGKQKNVSFASLHLPNREMTCGERECHVFLFDTINQGREQHWCAQNFGTVIASWVGTLFMLYWTGNVK